MTHDFPADFMTLGDGRALLRGVAASLVRWFDDRFRQMACEDGAEECRFPATIAEATLRRAGYFEAFPEGATALKTAEGSYWLPPAVCYHAYAMLAGAQLEAPARLTAAQTCFREADRPSRTPGRLWEFTMREAIFIGPREWVRDERARWTSRVEALGRELRLTGACEPATDSFFSGVGRGRSLIQQLKGLKDELRLNAGPETLAVASFNLHEGFFGKRFEITIGNDAAAESGCVAFGLERWALAFLRQRGVKAAEALIGA